MKKIKSILSSVLVLSILAVFAGCKAPEQTDEGENSKTFYEMLSYPLDYQLLFTATDVDAMDNVIISINNSEYSKYLEFEYLKIDDTITANYFSVMKFENAEKSLQEVAMSSKSTIYMKKTFTTFSEINDYIPSSGELKLVFESDTDPSRNINYVISSAKAQKIRNWINEQLNEQLEN